jgi:TRAP-type C4-dicarboxylate transport system permease small subunit
MSGIWRFYLTWQARLHTIEKVIAALLLLMIAGVVLAGTLSRYILKEPWFGTDRVSDLSVHDTLLLGHSDGEQLL